MNMLPNIQHDIIQQLSEISDSAWRIEQDYLPASVGNDALTALWKQLLLDYEKHIALLSDALKRELTQTH